MKGCDNGHMAGPSVGWITSLVSCCPQKRAGRMAARARQASLTSANHHLEPRIAAVADSRALTVIPMPFWPYHRHPCKSLSTEKRELSVRALESALLIRSGAAAAHVCLSAVGSCTLQNRTPSRRRSPRPRNHLHTRCRPASASTASSACWARAAWVRSTRPKRTSPRRSVYLKVIKAAWANRPQRYNQAHQRCRRDNEPLDRRHCNRPLKQPKIEDLP